MDITDIKPQEREVELVDPTGERTGITFKLRPPDAPEIKKIERELDNAVLRARGRLSTSDRNKFRDDRIVAGVSDWSFGKDSLTIEGERPNFTPARLRKLIKIDWIFRFLDTEMGDEGRFFEKLSEV